MQPLFPPAPPIPCPVEGCFKRFQLRGYLNTHLQNDHPDWVDPDMPPLVDSDSDTDSDVDPQEFDVDADPDPLENENDDLLPELDPQVPEEEGGLSGYVSYLTSFRPPSRLLSDEDGDDEESLPALTPLEVEEEYDIEDDYATSTPTLDSESDSPDMNLELGVALRALLDKLLEGDGSEEDSSPPSPVSNQEVEMSPERRETEEGVSFSTSRPATTQREYHDRISGRPCDAQGNILEAGTAPTISTPSSDDWAPYKDRLQFEVADLLYTDEQMSGGNIDKLLELWAASLLPHDPPFRNHSDMYQTIDSTPVGEVRWRRFEITHDGAESCPPDAPTWMKQSYEIWYRDVSDVVKSILGNPDFKDHIDYAPFRESDINGVRQLRDFMSGDWAWRQADEIAEDPNTHGAAFVPIILGSDKTTVSVATGQNEYYPLYTSIGNIHNSSRRGHRNGMVIVAFLAIPKTSRKYADDVQFRKFRRQLFHSSLSRILRSLKPGMTTPEVIRCGDGHFRKVVYGLGPYIADYPEQALLGCIVQGWCPICFAHKTNLDDPGAQMRSRGGTEDLVRDHELGDLWDKYGIVGDVIPFTNDFPRADIHELLAPDILHQLIKGTFKDHLVAWVELYLAKKQGKAGALTILSDVDRRIAIVPSFSGLRRFPQGRGFKQWTGDDSKALMKVYLPAIVGYLPAKVVSAVRAFIEFCYLVRREVHTPHTISLLHKALEEFHKKRTVFCISGVREEGFSLPRQHSCMHYEDKILNFGAPNGLCSSITESMHIRAVKEPWRRSNRFEALGQMLMSNQRLDKLAASRVQFKDRGMLEGSLLQSAQQKLLDWS
uniref:Transcriptional repressor TUP1 n=1 Tax=Ganoderma boninense TaxID=34458 RepID=A0A5K1K3W1_9APHY|nr:Transcriptional repressor TUP1 [Ganoderma boninense]